MKDAPKTETKRRRLIQLVNSLDIGGTVGGAEKMSLEIAERLNARYLDVGAYVLRRSGTRAEELWTSRLRDAGIALFFARQQASGLKGIFAQMGDYWDCLGDFLPSITSSCTERCDVINLLGSGFHSSHPTAMRVMQTEIQWSERPLAGFVLSQLVYPWAFRHEVAVSGDIATRLARRPLARAIRKRPVVITNGIDELLLAPSAEETKLERKLLPKRGQLIGSVGRLTKQKGFDVLLKSFRKVLDARESALVIVGSGPLEHELRALSQQLEIDTSVLFAGSREDVPAILRSLDLFVSSSRWEGFQIALLEAMAVGVPVVATRVSGAPELIRPNQTGYLVDPGDVSGLAAAMLRALSTPDESNAMAANAKRVAAEHTTAKVAAEYAKLLGFDSACANS